jgi:hypothetical protein
MRVVSVSRRTDIPAFYTSWFINRLRAGFCHWRNPFGGQIYRVSLAPTDVLAFVFWTRNPRPLLPHLPTIRADGHRWLSHMTINGYPRSIESHNPPLDAAIEAFHRLSEQTGPAFTNWRFDPILLSDQMPASYHIERFGRICERLAGATERCTFSFVVYYGKTDRNIAKAERAHGFTATRAAPLEEQRALIHSLRDIGSGHGITLYACCEPAMVGDGVEPSRCMDMEVIARLRGVSALDLKLAPTREACGCVAAADIGAYDTCAFGCVYCYATNSRQAALARLAAHDPDDSMLFRPPSLRGVDLATKESRSRPSVAAGLEGMVPLIPRS